VGEKGKDQDRASVVPRQAAREECNASAKGRNRDSARECLSCRRVVEITIDQVSRNLYETLARNDRS